MTGQPEIPENVRPHLGKTFITSKKSEYRILTDGRYFVVKDICGEKLPYDEGRITMLGAIDMDKRTELDNRIAINPLYNEYDIPYEVRYHEVERELAEYLKINGKEPAKGLALVLGVEGDFAPSNKEDRRLSPAIITSSIEEIR
jgi:hypothetical protein